MKTRMIKSSLSEHFVNLSPSNEPFTCKHMGKVRFISICGTRFRAGEERQKNGNESGNS